MSAYVCDRGHIDYLIQAALSRRLHPSHSCQTWIWDRNRTAGTYKRGELRASDHAEADRVGQMLWDENVASVRFRYGDDDQPLPGPIDCDYQYGRFRHSPYVSIDPVQVLKACDCLEYQSCEHDGWDASEAKAFIRSLRSAAWHALPGYEEATWGAPKPLAMA